MTTITFLLSVKWLTFCVTPG